MRGNPGRVAIAVAAAISIGCAPVVEGPVDRQRAIDRDDSARLAAQLAVLPGVVTASVVLHHAFRDPLGPGPASPATLAAVIVVDDQADRQAIRGHASRLARATLPELPRDAALPIEIAAAVHRPAIVQVGPFAVETSSRAPLKAVLAGGCAAIAALAGLLARSARRHRRASTTQ